MKTTATIFIFLLSFILFYHCGDTATNIEANTNEKKSVIGRIIDQASNRGSSGTLVKIINDLNAYQVQTDADGNFGFTDIVGGEYQLLVTGSNTSHTVTDTVGQYTTANPDWGDIYAKLFASVNGKILIEGLSDHSFVNVQLLGTDKSALTTNQGNFRIDFIFPDLYDIYISVEDQNYSSYHIKDIYLKAGEVFTVDTLLTYKFKNITLKAAAEIVLPQILGTNFTFAHGKYWYGKTIEGIYSYDPRTEEEKLVFSHFFLGDPKVIFDYDDGIWCTGDQATTWMHRKYSISGNAIIDSVSAGESFATYSIAWDQTENRLVSHGYTEMNLLAYSLLTKQVAIITPNLEYNANEYESIRFYDILIGENGNIYTLVRYKPKDLEEQLHLYIFDNLTQLNTVEIYKFPSLGYSRLCYKEGQIFVIENGGKIYEIILD